MTESIGEAVVYNPAQQEIIDQLGSTDRPTFPDDLRHALRRQLEDDLADVVEQIVEPPLFLSKHKISMLLGCEASFVASESEPFEWSVATARGTVAHKAIELWVGKKGKPAPLELVEMAMDRLIADDRGIADWLVALTEGERAELVGRVNDFVAIFVESFPPLKPAWVPVAESRVRAELFSDQIVLAGVIDLSLGRTRGSQAGKVLIDLKTGRPARGHIEDLRYYALLETLRIGVPPRLLVNYYLESGQPRTEAVTIDLLLSTTKRVADAVTRAIELEAGEREPNRVPSMACRWCPIQSDCSPGLAFLRQLDDED